MVCWGASPFEIDGVKKPPRAPTFMKGIDDVVQVAGDDDYWCGLRKGGDVRCWSGADDAVAVGISDAVEISRSGCARRADGTILCEWSAYGGKLTPPKIVAGVTHARSLCRNCECAIGDDRTATCWGTSFYNSLPNGESADLARTPWKIPGLSGALEMDNSYFFGSCARVAGTVKCWGGEWGCGSSATRESCWEPRPIDGITTATQIAVTEYHACARLSDGTVSCFGSNSSGQLGMPIADELGDAANVVPNLQHVVQVAVGGGEPCGGCGSTCAVDDVGAVWCFGEIVGKRPKPVRIDLTPKR